MSLQIGSRGWVAELEELTRPLGASFWGGFSPVPQGELDRLEKRIQRRLPEEFVEFYRTVGCGDFPMFGEFLSPDEIVACLAAPIYFVLGSLAPGKEWCSREDHVKLWLSRGAENAVPDRFTDDALTFESVKLYDLLQFGSNGCCCYHQLHVGEAEPPVRYCLLTDSMTMEEQTPTFSQGVERTIQFQLMAVEGL